MNRSDKKYGIAALFNSPDDIIQAAKKVTEEGYTKYDVHTPYPVHGMDKAMSLKPSKLGFITLVFGLAGAAIALLFMFWAMSIYYPMIIGGKPFFALPAFIPVTFEVTVLLATLSTVIGMITFFFKYPDQKHPLHDTEYMKKVSVDKFGVCIEVDDPLFNEEKITELFKGLNSESIQTIFHPVEEKQTVLEPKFLGFLAAVAIVVSFGTYVALNKILYTVPFNWMMEQPRVDVQSKSEFFTDGFGMRTPVEGSVARGFIPYEYKGMNEPTVPLSNPLKPTKEVFELGKKKYLSFCSPCHGNYGDGDSRLGENFPKPPSLHSAKAREWKDGNLYHIIVNGQNVMPSYETQLTRDERWAIVYHIRALQKAKNATEQEIQLVKKESVENAK